MKYKILSLIVLFNSFGNCFCQVSSSDYTMAMYKKISAIKSYVDERYKNTLTIRRIETGILDNLNNQLIGTTERQLFSGHNYLICAFTDARVADMKLKVYKKEGQELNIIKTVNEYSAYSTADLIGDIEETTITPDADALYEFEISATGGINKTSARYCILVFSRETTTPMPATPTIYNIDNYSVCEWDAQKNKYGDWGSATNYSCSFEINSDESIVKWKRPNSVTTYYITDKDNSLDKWITYTIRSNNGDRYAFMIPKLDGEYVRMIKFDGKENNPVTEYHIIVSGSGKSKMTYSIASYSDATYNTTLRKYNNFGSDTTFSCLFEVNADETILTWRESSGTITTFYIVKKDDSDSKWSEYTIKSAYGTQYTFKIPKDDSKYIRVIIKDGNLYNPLRNYHMINKWAD